MLGNKTSISLQTWPEVISSYLVEDTFEYPVSFNGKTRFKLELSANLAVAEIEKAALNHEMSKKWLEGMELVKIIIVPKKIINIVVK